MPDKKIDDAYQDARGIVWVVSSRFQQAYGGEAYEWFQDANLAFLDAFRTYHPGHGTTFLSWVRYRVEKTLLERARTEQRRSGYLVRQAFTDPPQPSRFNFRRFISELSEDAQTVAQIVIDCPLEIRLDRDRRAGLVQYLESRGWNLNRVYSTFNEIAEALA